MNSAPGFILPAHLRSGLVPVLPLPRGRRHLLRGEVDDRDLGGIRLELSEDVVQLLHKNSTVLLRQQILFHLFKKFYHLEAFAH
jgi:hypothetical protein